MPHQPAYTHNAQPISREQFYAIACDPARSVAVEACAGAGKTWMLVSRMLRALLGGAAPHEILAITFTKKAAGEMRQRLQEWLEDFAHQPLEQLEKELLARGIDENSLQGAQDKRKQLQNLYQTLLASGRPLQIRTFHSWFAALLSSAPLALLQERGLPTHYELLEDDKEAKAEVWRPFLQAVAQDAGLHADYAAIVAAHGRSQAHKALEAALDKRVEFQLADEAGIVDASVPPFGTQHPALAGLEFPAQALAGDMAQARWLARAKLLGAESNKTPQKAADAVVDAFACADLDARLDGLRKAFFVATADRLSKNLEKFAPAQEAEPELQQLCAARAQHAAWQHQDRMARLSRCLIVCFAALKRARGWVDMNDVERTALTLLSDPILSGWVQERLDARVRHLLIDEFQDTNPLQWQALHAWLSGYAGAGGGQAAPSVFIVGDPKQSIYRFRRAEPQVFRAAQAFVQDAFGGDLLACDHTRRNALGVIATVNSAMQAAQDAQEYSGFRQHTTESDQAGLLQRLPPITKEDAAQDEAPAAEEVLAGDGGVQGLPWRDSLTEPRHEAEETQRMQECAQAARWVAAQLASGLQPKDIMVLARQRERLARLAEALRAQHIPCVQPEKADLAEAPEVQDMVALLDVLVSPAHDLSLARALKSPLFGCDDALLTALARLRRQEEYQQFSWFDLLQKQELFTLDISALAANLTQYKDWVAELPPHDALQAIYQHGDVLARFAAAAPAPQRTGVLANLRALLGAALQQDGGRYLTPYAFVRALKKGDIPAPARADVGAVRLLTVHGAKGLEAHSVLLLDTDALPKKAESMAVLVDWPGEQELPRRFIFLASESRPPPSAEGALAQELAERQREALNTLYVAVTRAKQCLALSCVQASRANPGSWWARLAPLMQQDVQPQASAVAADAHADAAFTLLELPRLLLDQATPAAQPKPPEPEGLSARQGQAMHALLEQVGAAGLPLEVARTDGWNARRLAKLAREFALPAAAAQAAAAMAQTILNGEGAWAWDEAQLELAVNEAPLQHQGQSLRLDRLVRLRTARGGAHWWVLDYKSAAEPQQQPELMAQLQRYRQAVQLQQPGEAVGAAFLTGEGRVVVMGD